MHSRSKKRFGMLTFVLLKSTRVFTMTSLIDLLSSCAYTYICLLTYSNINVKLFQEITQNSKRSFCLFWFTFVFTGHFLYLRADSTQTSGVAKASSTSLPASLATENYQVCHPVLAPLWSKSSGCRHYLHSPFSCPSAHSAKHWKAKELPMLPSWLLVETWKGDVRCTPSKWRQEPQISYSLWKTPQLNCTTSVGAQQLNCIGQPGFVEKRAVWLCCWAFQHICCWDFFS